ncbi:MAG: tetratricopeptide repeat protein [Planctomycetes bacterium]|nr:tetratricopeptide repeat protein [Planctomycetota bacterium]
MPSEEMTSDELPHQRVKIRPHYPDELSDKDRKLAAAVGLPLASPPPSEQGDDEGTLLQPGRLELVHGSNTFPGIPGYELVGELARGGMGVVFTARDLSLDREVAIKTLLPELAKRSDLAAQFDREARITARLQHPGVPPVHALGTLSDGRPFLVMKLIRGRTLHEEIEAADRDTDLARLLGVFEQICQTVGYAHSLGIIHRDLKPLNVMVGSFGEVQVMDWGLAKEVRGADTRSFGDDDSQPDAMNRSVNQSSPSTGATRLGLAKGTSSYMPPEQARGRWDEVDTRADVFTLGGILCTILTGQPPYTGVNGRAILALAIEANLDGAIERLHTCGADPELIALSKRCLSPEACDRPGTGKVVAEAVAAYRSGVEHRARKAETEWAVSEARAEEAAHGHALAYCTLGSALQDKNDIAGAIEAYNEAIRLAPHFAAAYANLGVALHDCGDRPGAIAAYREAMRLDPTDPKVYSNLGIALKESGDVAGAITALKEVVQLDPENPEAHYDLGNILQAVGNLEGAISSFEQAFHLAPDNSIIHLNLAVVYLLGKRKEEAISAAKEVIWRNPLDPNADTAHGIVLLALGDTAGGRAALSDAVRNDPDRWETTFRQLFPNAPMPSRPLDQ